MNEKQAKPNRSKLGVLILVLLATALLAVWLEPTRAIWGGLSGQAFFQNRPTVYWRNQLHPDDPAARDAAIGALSEGRKESIPVLVELLRTPGESWEASQARLTAAELLKALGPEAEPAIPVLLETLSRNDPHLQTLAAEALVDAGASAEQAIPALTPLLQSVQAPKIARLMSKYGPDAHPALEPLAELMSDRQADIESRWNAARTLGKLREKGAPAIDALVVQLKAPEDNLREHAAEALGDIGPPAARTVPDLIPILKDSFTRARRDAARSLGNIGPPASEALPALEELLKDKEKMVRDAAKTAIEKIKPTDRSPNHSP